MNWATVSDRFWDDKIEQFKINKTSIKSFPKLISKTKYQYLHRFQLSGHNFKISIEKKNLQNFSKQESRLPIRYRNFIEI